MCAWLTVAFALDPQHPIVSARRHGHAGPESHVELRRAGGAPPISFEPASRINGPMKLIKTLAWSVLHTDGAIPAFKGEHCQQIAHVIRMLCGVAETLSAEEQAAGIVSMFVSGAVEVEHAMTTHGTGGQKYEAAMSLRREIDPLSGRPIGPVRFARDADTGELVIAVSDLQEAARRYTGSKPSARMARRAPGGPRLGADHARGSRTTGPRRHERTARPRLRLPRFSHHARGRPVRTMYPRSHAIPSNYVRASSAPPTCARGRGTVWIRGYITARRRTIALGRAS